MSGDEGFHLHPSAAEDITEIWQFIAQDKPHSATRFRENILETIRGLVHAPHQGHRRNDLTSRPLRFHTVGKYPIAYAPEEKPLLVVAVIHGNRHPRIIAAILQGRG
jgi:plasmid stabilization system protein ParE